MYNLPEGSAQGRMPGAGSAPAERVVTITRTYEVVPCPSRTSADCYKCAADKDPVLCLMLGSCLDCVFVER